MGWRKEMEEEGGGWEHRGGGGGGAGAHLKFEVLDGIAHADGQGPALHQKLDGVVQLLRQVPRQHLACTKCQTDSVPLEKHEQQFLTAASHQACRAVNMGGGRGGGGAAAVLAALGPC